MQSKVGKEEYYKAPNAFSVCTLYCFVRYPFGSEINFECPLKYNVTTTEHYFVHQQWIGQLGPFSLMIQLFKSVQKYRRYSVNNNTLSLLT